MQIMSFLSAENGHGLANLDGLKPKLNSLRFTGSDQFLSSHRVPVSFKVLLVLSIGNDIADRLQFSLLKSCQNRIGMMRTV
jgi:hypothetical protein